MRIEIGVEEELKERNRGENNGVWESRWVKEDGRRRRKR